MIDSPTMDDVRNSIGYQTTCRALDLVFGKAWSIINLRHGESGYDFRMEVSLPQYSLAVWIDVDGTYYRGFRETPGVIAVGVPTPHLHIMMWGGMLFVDIDQIGRM